MKEFLSFYAERYLRAEGLTPESHPIVILDALEKSSMRRALNGLRQAINDCVEMSFHFNHLEVEKLDAELRGLGIVTLSELRRRYAKGYAKIVKRGRIRSETEYHLVRNVLDDPTEKPREEREWLQRMLSEWERA